MDPEEERIAAEEARIAKLAGGGPDDPQPEPDADETMASSTVPEDDEDPEAVSEEALRAANEAAETDPEAPPADADPDADPAEPAAPAPRGSTTFRERIGQLTAAQRTLKQQLADRDAEIARLRTAPTAEPAAPDPTSPPDPAAPQRQQFGSQAEFETAVAAEATRRATVNAFNEKCNDVEARGSKAFKEAWVQAKDNLALLDDNGSIPLELLTPALETSNPHRVLLNLGQDPDLAARLLRMTPTKRAMEIARMDVSTPAAPPRRTAAPPPVDPIRGRAPASSTSTAPSDKDSDADWLRKRNAQIRAREAAQA